MSYGTENRAWGRLRAARYDDRIQWETATAKALREQHGMTRDEALREAARLYDAQPATRRHA